MRAFRSSGIRGIIHDFAFLLLVLCSWLYKKCTIFGVFLHTNVFGEKGTGCKAIKMGSINISIPIPLRFECYAVFPDAKPSIQSAYILLDGWRWFMVVIGIGRFQLMVKFQQWNIGIYLCYNINVRVLHIIVWIILV